MIDWQYERWLVAYREQAEMIAQKFPDNTARVLDVGCGAGYGAEILKGVSSSVIGIDNDVNVLPSGDGFLLADAINDPLPEEVDVIVANQFIEHLHQPSAFIAKAIDMLPTGGLFLLSTPNRAMRLLPGQKPTAEDHVEEYTVETLRGLLGSIPHQILGVYGNHAIRQYEAIRKPTMRFALCDPSGALADGVATHELLRRLAIAINGCRDHFSPSRDEGKIDVRPTEPDVGYPLDLMVVIEKGAL